MAEIKEDIKNIITPSAIQIDANHMKIGDKLAKTIFIFTYPRYLSTGWFSPVLNMAEMMDISIFIHPTDSAIAMKRLRKAAGQIEAQISEGADKGSVRNPMLETALHDVETLRDTLQQGQENLFSVGVYITIYADDVKALNKLEGTITNLMESRLVYAKSALFRQLEGFTSVLPLGMDKLEIHTPLNSKTLSSFFPFVSIDLTTDEGIVYGINSYNNTLVIFDRFSLENANQVIFAKSGSGKSYATKLEALRLLMMGVNVIVIDPENEYGKLADAVGGSYFKISLSSGHHVNPFDIPIIPKGENPSDILKSHFLSLTGLLKIMLGEVSTDEAGVLDRAIAETYSSREITPDRDFSKSEPPLLQDLVTVLKNMEGGRSMAERLYKYTEGSFAGFINNPTNIDIRNRFIVFSIRDLEDELRPVAMYIVLNFIWNLIRADLRRRILIVDEAWIMMKHEDGASFLFGLVKRARKYFLGVSTITQDVEDFLRSPFGRPIITNSAMQILLKQSPSTVDLLAKTFNLTEGEKNLLLEVSVGQGIFAAGLKRTAIQVVASYLEDKIITTDPSKLLAEQQDQPAG
jgi:conjugal transfer ATP-binding protein TraC